MSATGLAHDNDEEEEDGDDDVPVFDPLGDGPLFFCLFCLFSWS